MSQEFETDLEIAQDSAEEDAPAAPIPTSFGTVTDRLSEIAEVMEDGTMPLDDALDLLEEAVALGMQASSLLESDMNERDQALEEDEAEDSVAEDGVAENDAAEDGATEVTPDSSESTSEIISSDAENDEVTPPPTPPTQA